MPTTHFLSLALAATVGAVTFAACGNFLECIDGNGDVRTEDRSVGPFRGIEIDGSMDVKLTQGSTQSVRVEAESNIIPAITTTVKNGTLVIDSRECISTTRGITVHVTMPDVASLTVNGSGSFTSESPITATALALTINGSGGISLPEVQASSITTTISGSGNVGLAGKGTAHSIRIDGSGSVDAARLETESTVVTVQGSGNSRVWATRTLTVVIEGSGDVRYKGSPTTDITKNGSGVIERF